MDEKPWRKIAKENKPRIPLKVFPTFTEEILLAYHESSGAPVDYFTCSATSTIAAAVFDRADIVYKGGRTNPLTLYQICIGESGTNKSYPFSIFPNKLISLYREHNKAIIEQNRKIEEKIGIFKKRMNQKSISEAEIDNLQNRIIELETEKLPLLPKPRTDATMEALEMIASESNGKACIISSEGSLINAIAGRTYNQRGNVPNIDFILKGYDEEESDSVRVTRRADNGKPRLCLCLAGQNTILNTLMTVGEQSDRGFPNRCIFYYPDTMFGHDAHGEKRIPEEMQTEWDKRIETLFHRNRTGKIKLPLDDAARYQHDEYRNVWEKRKEKYINDGQIMGWIGKAADKTARFAGIIALMDNPNAEIISLQDFENAREFFESYSFPMALYAYGLKDYTLPKHLCKLLQTANELESRSENGYCTKGELKDRLRSCNPWKEDQRQFDNDIKWLRESDYIRIKRPQQEHGRPPEIIVINPYYKL